MILPDVNVLVYAHRSDSPNHDRYRQWLEGILHSSPTFAVTDLVLSGFVRIVTHPKVFRDPTPLSDALEFVSEIRSRPNCVVVAPGQRHWDIFLRLCRQCAVRGNLVPDAYLAAMAIEGGLEWVTTDRDFSRFDELRWRHPLKD
ncbi:MAG: type II toxin-antitoxin system VapC family toxin [Thermoanaerobaculales bacterium]|nr:type II toxin-antitoxin system VapC family toxin [Thermoanaerobaculales bacterium]